ncbi:MAG: argininosuccinate lyase [Candidatus Micrarchaeota archaeon]
MAKLWEKGYKLDKDAEEYTVGEDYLLDKVLLPYDVKASIAHAKMLGKCGYLSADEVNAIVKELEAVLEKGLEIKKGDEDCHTAIENYLVKKLGKAGKKIHTGRSRNDQCMVALRFYMKDSLGQVRVGLKGLVKELRKKSKVDAAMPGYTHTRKAMPSSAGMLFGSYADMLEDELVVLDAVKKMVDQNPLGSAAGYGVPLRIDRGMTTKLLGFVKTQRNPIYCANSRGKFEALCIGALSSIMLGLNKMASDLILFSCPEFGFFELPKEFCTGSSIMPQKMNPDALEMMRANYHVVVGHEMTTKGICAGLISGYHRDYQLTKEPLIKSFGITVGSLKVMGKIIHGLKVDKKKMQEAMTPEIYATERACKMVEAGVPFREAYRKVAMGEE